MINITHTDILAFIYALILVIFGYISANLVSITIIKLTQKRLSVHQRVLAHKIFFYTIFGVFILMALQHLGFNLGVLIGATGILTVALGFASQTSISNLISGLFLIGEKPFSIGDTIVVNGISGEVLSIDILSVKLKTCDNTFVRIPNETLIKTTIANLSHFPNRRLDLNINVPYKEDLQRIKKILLTTVKNNNLCLKVPEPQAAIQSFGDYTISLQLSIWVNQQNYADAKNTIQEEIKKNFELNNITISQPAYSISLNGIDELLSIKKPERENA